MSYTVIGFLGQHWLRDEDVASLEAAAALAAAWQPLAAIQTTLGGQPAVARHFDRIEVRKQFHGPGVELEWIRRAAVWELAYDAREQGWPEYDLAPAAAGAETRR